MMTAKRVAWLVTGCVCVLPLTMGIECAPASPADGGDSGGDTQLTETEAAAVLAAMRSAGGIVQASGLGQTAIDAHEHQPVVLAPGDLTVGTCPVVTLDATLGESALDVLVDFGTGCTMIESPEFACAGSAEGQLDAQARTIDLTFNDIGCTQERSLRGEVSAVYDLTSFDVTLEGDWNLTYSVGEAQIQTNGQATVSYDTLELATTIGTFEGSVQQGADLLTVAVDGLKVSYIRNGTFIPFAGTIAVSGTSVRSFTIRFDADSPTTGQVEVSINGSAYFTVDLSSL